MNEIAADPNSLSKVELAEWLSLSKGKMIGMAKMTPVSIGFQLGDSPAVRLFAKGLQKLSRIDNELSTIPYFRPL